MILRKLLSTECSIVSGDNQNYTSHQPLNSTGSFFNPYPLSCNGTLVAIVVGGFCITGGTNQNVSLRLIISQEDGIYRLEKIRTECSTFLNLELSIP